MSLIGKKLSEEHKLNISQAMMGRKVTDKTRAKISLANTGKKRTKEAKLKMRNSQLGKKHTEDQIMKFKLSHSGEKHWNHKGELSSISAKHKWIETLLGKPQKCDICGTTQKRKYEWANKDHTYKKRVEDWQRLCTTCHRNYDYKFLKIKK